VTVVEAGQSSTNLPDACCDAIFMRDVYHHFTHPAELVRSLFAALKPGGRLAIIDFEPRRGSSRPDGVPEDRAGHGIRPEAIVAEVAATGLSLNATITDWPDAKPADQRMFLVLFGKPQS
jgi:predicted methyltransferase